MDKLRAIQYFVAAAEEGSLTGAARRLEVSVPAVQKLLAKTGVALADLRSTFSPWTSPSTELVDDARSPLAFAIPAVLFAMGFFYVVGCLHELHVHGGQPSFRTFIGGIPMLTSMNMAAQLRRVAHLRKKLRGIDVTSEGQPSGDADTTAGSPSSHSSS